MQINHPSPITLPPPLYDPSFRLYYLAPETTGLDLHHTCLKANCDRTETDPQASSSDPQDFRSSSTRASPVPPTHLVNHPSHYIHCHYLRDADNRGVRRSLCALRNTSSRSDNKFGTFYPEETSRVSNFAYVSDEVRLRFFSSTFSLAAYTDRI